MSNDYSCVEKLKVLAHDTRLAVVEALIAESQPVRELAHRLGVEQSLLSHHLRILRDANLVTTERAGKHIHYQLAPQVKAVNGNGSINLGCCEIAFYMPQVSLT